jgi:hypothetical protein
MLHRNKGCPGSIRVFERDKTVTNYFSSFAALGLAMAVAFGLTAAVVLPTGAVEVAPRVASANDAQQLEPIVVVGVRPIEIASR